MRRIHRPLAIAVFVVLGCTKPKPTIVLDGWWNRDFAKETCSHATSWLKENAAAISQLGCDALVSCPELKQIADNCLGDPTQQVRDFETQLATEFASDAQCAEVNFVRFYEPKAVDAAASKALAAPHWSLSLQFTPGDKEQSWEMLRSADHGGYTKGAGSPKEIAHKVCGIVAGRGAALAN